MSIADLLFSIIKPHRMHEMRTIVIDDPVTWAAVSLSCMRAIGLLIHQMALLDAAVTTLL